MNVTLIISYYLTHLTEQDQATDKSTTWSIVKLRQSFIVDLLQWLVAVVDAAHLPLTTKQPQD